ncbi:MAG: hypothetical protein C0623_05170 [Desulfuromonas sp.]|nr:MAG: hypothetical protein C0623_05170 [Desulfuromonas sp.]
MGNTSNPIIKTTSLRTKILVPFFVILLVLGSVATIGTILIITGTLEKTADERLSAFQHQIYQDIRGLEELLVRRSNVFEISSHLESLSNNHDQKTIARIENLINENLVTEGMTTRTVLAKDAASYPDKELAKLMKLAGISHNPQIRFTTRIGPEPAITLVKPVYFNQMLNRYIVMQAYTGTGFLHKISTPLNLKTALYDLTGALLTTSEKDHDFLSLDEKTLARVLQGERVFISHERLLKRRNLFYEIPLGTTDMLIVQLEMPLTDISLIINALASRSAIAILIAMLIGGYIYYRQVTQIITPAQQMMLATQAIGEGNLDYRIQHQGAGEFAELADSFNHMMQNISNLYEHKIENERELTKVQEELKYKDILEEKNQRIEQVNAEMKLHLKELSTLLQLNQAMASTLDLDELFNRVINSLSDLLNCNMASLLLYNHDNGKLEISHTLGIEHSAVEEVDFNLDEGISGEVARTRKTIYVEDIKKDKRYLNYKGNLESGGSLLSLPLLSKNRLCGVLNLHKQKQRGFNKDDIKLAKAVSNQAAISIENSQLYNQAKEQSVTDELTGLSNRRHFQDIFNREIIHARRYSTNISLIMIDIDYFKNYNDTHGHLQGDIALKTVAQILLQNTRGIDLAVRFGGEEFVILLPKTTIAGARITAEKLREIIEDELFPGENESQPGGKLTISLGVASYPENTDDLKQLLDLSDQALYQAKESGRNRVVVWDKIAKLAG